MFTSIALGAIAAPLFSCSDDEGHVPRLIRTPSTERAATEPREDAGDVAKPREDASAPAPAEPTELFVSDLDFQVVSNGWGPVERNTSNGEDMAGDGKPITLGGVVHAGVASIMVSFSSLRGQPMHASHRWITDVLKGELGLRGIVISDWSGLRELPGSYEERVLASVNAGIDVAMYAEVPGGAGVATEVPVTAEGTRAVPPFRQFLETLERVVRDGRVSWGRVDDAVRRVLTVKCEAGFFERTGPTAPRLTAKIGSGEHHALARRAARATFVLLQNEGDLLPLAKDARILVTGSGSDSAARQSGGWTMAWQAPDRPFAATTVLEGLRRAARELSHVRYSADGSFGSTSRPDVAVLVASEAPYAEWLGDRPDLAFPADDLAVLDRLHATGVPVVVVLLTGRPLVIEPHLSKARAWLAAWLPGAEGGPAIADVLFGDSAPTGRLARAWPRRESDLPENVADEIADPLFPFGYGLG